MEADEYYVEKILDKKKFGNIIKYKGFSYFN